MSEIEIIELRILPESRKSLKGFCDIKIGTWTINDFRIVQQNGQRLSVLGPQVSWLDPETREIRFKGILTIPSNEKQRIDTEILYAYQKELEARHDEPRE